MPSTHDFKGRRRELALVFREWRTAKQAARELGVETGSVFGLITRMHAERTLRADSDPEPPTRGTQYKLTEDAALALGEALAGEPDQGQLAGQLADGQRVLVVSGKGLAGVQKILANPALSADVAWGAWVGASWLLAMSPSSGFFALEKLTVELECAGYECQRGQVDGLQVGAQLRENADRHSERIGANL